MVEYDDDNNALTLGDDDAIAVGDYDLKYSADDDEWQAQYSRPIGGELGNHGDVSGTYVKNSQVGKNAIELTTGNIEVPHDDSLNLTSELSISMWVNFDSFNADFTPLFSKTLNSSFNNENYIFDVDGQNLDFWFATDNITGTTTLTKGTWYFVTATVGSSNITLYIDGVQEAQVSRTATPSTNTKSLIIGGASSDAFQFSGLIDDVRLYDRELSSSEVTDLFNSVDVANGLVSNWNFEYPESPRVAIDSTGDAFPKNRVPRSTTDSLVPQGLAESVSAGEALADDGNTYSSVQTAVDNASGWVFVGPGTFNESVTISTEGLTLEGCNKGTTIQGSAGGDGQIQVTAPNCTISNLSVQSDSTGDGIVINSQRVTVEDCSLSDTVNGIEVRGDNCVIRGNTFSTADSSGIDVKANSAIISGNKLSNIGNHGIEVDPTEDSIIANNNISDTNSNSVYLRNSNGSCNDNIVVGNRMINAGTSGVNLAGNDNIIANNRISDSTDAAIKDNGVGTVLDDNLTGPSN